MSSRLEPYKIVKRMGSKALSKYARMLVGESTGTVCAAVQGPAHSARKRDARQLSRNACHAS